MERVDVIIVGAGVVGLAVAAELSARKDDCSIILMERHRGFGQETSSRNSEVIHAGIYYPTGSLKSRLCVEGNRLLYDFCRKWEIAHSPLGKLIVASNSEELPALEALLIRGRANGVPDLKILDQRQTARLEPHVTAVAAVFSPSTGLIDSHALMSRLEWIARHQGVLPAYLHELNGVESVRGGYRVWFHGPEGIEDSVFCKWLVNCAGLGADRIAEAVGINLDEAGYRIFPCKGEYFTVPNSKARLLFHLIYPPPLEGLKGLGVHVTKTLDGRMRLGPNAFFVDRPDYAVDSGHALEFFGAAKRFLPFLELRDLQPDMAGIRPKLQQEGAFRDFVVQHEFDRGLEGFINLVGIESPGLTSCLSLAKMVSAMMEFPQRRFFKRVSL